MRGHVAGTLAWVGVTASAATLVAGAVRLAVDSVASPASLAAPAPRSGPRLPVEVDDAPAAGRKGRHRGGATPETTVTVIGGRRAFGSSEAAASGGSSRAAGGATDPATPLTTAPGSSAPGSGPPPAASDTTTTTSPPSPTTTNSTTSSTTASTTSTTEQPTYTYRATGGTIGVHCNDNAVSLSYATPNSGFTTTVNNSGPDVVDVRFDKPGWRSEIQVTCSAGQPQPQITDQAT